MKKQLFITALLLIITFIDSSYSQTGYKDVKWGMNLDKVKELGYVEISKGQENYFFGFAAAFYYETGKLNSESEYTDPLEEYYKSNRITFLSSKSGEDDLMFYFIDASLVAVELVFSSNENEMLTEIEKKYGKSKLKYFEYFHRDAKVNAWFNSGDRIVLFMKKPSHSDRIVYLDKKFYQNISKTEIKRLEEEKNGNTNFVQNTLNYYKKYKWYTTREDIELKGTKLEKPEPYFGFNLSADDFSLGSLSVAHVYQNSKKPIESYNLNEYNVEPGVKFYFTDEDELVEIRIGFKDYSLKINENLEKKFGKAPLKRYARQEVAFENTRIIKAWYNIPETIVTFEHTGTGYDFVNFLSKNFYNSLIDYAIDKKNSELKKKSQKID